MNFFILSNAVRTGDLGPLVHDRHGWWESWFGLSLLELANPLDDVFEFPLLKHRSSTSSYFKPRMLPAQISKERGTCFTS